MTAVSLSSAVLPLREELVRRRLTISVAESCTGGLVSAALTDLPGSSEYFLGGMVTYANGAKIDLLGVDREMIERYGAVSPEVAELMARGVLKLFQSDVGVSVTGVAGPTADGPKPVGLTYVAAARGDRHAVREHRFHGDRAANRAAGVEAAIQIAFEILS